jgi:hypothetical protein
MKTTFAFLFGIFLSLSIYGQSDTVYYSSGCDNTPKGQYFNFWLQNNIFYSSGSIGGICCGTNFLIYRISNDTIFMRKGHQGDVCYCMCYFPFEFRIKNCNLPSYRIIVHQTSIDTVIYAQPTITSIFGDSGRPSVSVYPNPARETITVHLLGNWSGSVNFEMYNIIGNKVLSRFDITETFFLDRGGLSAGAYFYKLRTKNGDIFTGKILLE